MLCGYNKAYTSTSVQGPPQPHKVRYKVRAVRGVNAESMGGVPYHFGCSRNPPLDKGKVHKAVRSVALDSEITRKDWGVALSTTI